MNDTISAWRVRVELSGYDEQTSWTTNYDIIWEIMDDKFEAMPGADVRFEELTIDLSSPIPEFEVTDITENFPQWTDLDTTDLPCGTEYCDNEPVVRRRRRLWCRPCADREFDNMPWQRSKSDNFLAKQSAEDEERPN